MGGKAGHSGRGGSTQLRRASAVRSIIRSLPAYREGPYLRTILCDLAITILILQATTMADFIEVTGLEQIRPGAGSRFIVADKEMAIFNVDGKICAISDHLSSRRRLSGNGKAGWQDRNLSGAWNEIRCHHRMLRGHFGLRCCCLPSEDCGRENHGGRFLEPLAAFLPPGLRLETVIEGLKHTGRKRRCFLTG